VFSLGVDASVMLASGMAMRLRKTLGSSQQLRLRHSLNGFCFAHDHAGRSSAMHECAGRPSSTMVMEWAAR